MIGGGAGTFKYARESTTKTTEAIDFDELDRFTPQDSNVLGESFILDTLVPTSSTSFTITNGWGWSGNTATIRVSADGTANSWTTISSTQAMENNQNVTVSHSSNFRYIRIKHNTSDVNFGNITTTNQPLLSRAQSTFANGLYWIKDRENSNNHQLVSSEYSGVIGCPTVGSYQSTFPAYSAPSGNSVAWCWGTDATGLNKKAGFEIIQQLGTKTYTTVNHRLEKEPKCIIAFAGRGDLALTMYHASLGPNYRATMSSALQFYNEPAWWGGDPTDFTATTFGVGNTSYTNDDENFNGGMTYFVWTDIPGYSDFGSYEGNGTSNGNGPFIYTGFKPAFLIIKNADATGDWVILDTTRTPNNVNEVAFKGNSAIPEAADANYSVDFLSNGFKIKSNGDADTNASSNTYVYMAFAENPFGGENQPPATAR